MLDPKQWNKFVTIGAALILALGVGFLDYLTGTELSFSIFYIIPVLGTSWFVGRYPGLAMALLCSILWLTAELADGATFSHYLIPIWNALVRLIFFSIIGVVVPYLRLELERSMTALSRLSNLLPLCAWCRQLRDEDGAWLSIEEYIATHTGTEVTHGICPGCAEKYFPPRQHPVSRPKDSRDAVPALQREHIFSHNMGK